MEKYLALVVLEIQSDYVFFTPFEVVYLFEKKCLSHSLL